MPITTEIKPGILPQNDEFLFDDIPGTNPTFSPGAGVVFTFGPSDLPRAEQYVLGYHRPNPDANNALQVCIAIGGKVDKSLPLVSSLKNNIVAKTNGVDTLLASSLALAKQQDACVYNHDSGEGWDMSYVYVTQHIAISLEDLMGTVNTINAKAAEKLTQDPNARVSIYEIYKFGDILDIINRNAKLEEKAKVGTKIVNQLTAATDDVIVFDDYATEVLFAKEVLALKQKIEGQEHSAPKFCLNI